jgi:RNA polymerase sigma factor (sigma-70 family)
MSRLPVPEEFGLLRKAAATLDADEREVLRLSAGEGLGYDNIASRLGLSPEEAERLLARALYRLDRALERQKQPWWRRLW